MKRILLGVIVLFSLPAFCQSILTTHKDSISTQHDINEVDHLITVSRQHKWIDSYKCLHYADQALLLAQTLDYKKGITEAYNLKGFCFWTFGDNDLAVQAAMQAMELATKENNTSALAESYYILARGYMDLRESVKSKEFIRKAEVLANQEGNWEQVLSIYNLKGVIFFIDNKIDSALYFYNKAFAIGNEHEVDPINFPRILSNIGECYMPENAALAFSHFTKALALARETNNKIAEASITSIIGHAYLQQKNLTHAETNLHTALHLAQALGLRRVIRHAYAGLVEIKLQQGRGNEAVVYLQRYYEVRDSLLNSSKIRQIVELEAKHELQLKEQNIKLLESEKRIQTIWKNLLIGFILLLALFSIALFQVQRFRYRKNREMLNLEIDYLTRQHKETTDRFKESLIYESDEVLESYDQKLLKKAISIVDDNIKDPQLSVEKMAMEMNMSRTSLHRKIKSITGFAPSELIRIIRLRRAAKLIANRVDSATQIALMVGFDDYAHFSKAFKKHFGTSPSGYEAHTKSQSPANSTVQD